MIEWTHQERECYLWDSNFYPFLSTAGLVLATAQVSPAVHGSSHGLTSFSGYLPPHVDPQHHFSPDIHTHHHNTLSTIFTPGGSWRYPYLSGSGQSTVTQGESHLECLSVNEVSGFRELFLNIIIKQWLGFVFTETPVGNKVVDRLNFKKSFAVLRDLFLWQRF